MSNARLAPVRSGVSASDVRGVLRRDHEAALAALDALRAETEPARCLTRLAQLRRTWVIHALAEETVVYKALESADQGGAAPRADERFVEHELVEGLFDKVSRSRPGALEWHARLNVARSLIERHIEGEEGDLFSRLERCFDATALDEMGERFELARDKLTLLEEAKAA
jgi:hemerythrin superfamily protein